MKTIRVRSLNCASNLLLGALLLLVGGCATSATHQAYIQELQNVDASAMVMAKAQSFEPLGLGEIEELVAKGVPDETILYHLRKSRAIYRLNTTDVERLQKAGVSQEIIDYMLVTPEKYFPVYYPPPYYYPPYYYSPYYYAPYYPYYYYGPSYYHHHGIRAYPIR